MTKLSIRALLLLALCSGITEAGWSQRESSCTRGKPNALIRIDVYSDYESPGSRAFFLQTMKSVFADYADTGKACVIYREFPLNDHPHAALAARYAKAAQQLGSRQWSLVAEALFQSQPQWSKDGEVDKAVAAALDAADMDALRKQLQSPSVDDAVANDVLSGLAQQVRSTPTIILNGGGRTEAIEGALRYTALKPRLEALLAE
jgi:protein-disulfide isomerase